jgi:hypothetical protein
MTQVFVPGLGFRSADGGLALRAPVEVVRRSVSLWLGRVVSTRERTDIDYAFDADASLMSERSAWVQAPVSLRDSNGRIYRAGGRGGGGGTAGRLSVHATFEMLDPRARRAELRVDTPLGPWTVPFELIPLTDSDVSSAMPLDERSTDGDVTVELTALARSSEYTAIRLTATGNGSIRFVRGIVGGMRLAGPDAAVVLEDDALRRYKLRSPVHSVWPEAGAYQETLLFAPLSESARELKLTLGSILVELRGGDCTIAYPSEVGDYRFGDFPIRLVASQPDERDPERTVIFRLESARLADGRMLVQPGRVLVDGTDVGYRVQRVGTTRDTRTLDVGVAHPGRERFTMALRYPVTELQGRWELHVRL